MRKLAIYMLMMAALVLGAITSAFAQVIVSGNSNNGTVTNVTWDGANLLISSSDYNSKDKVSPFTDYPNATISFTGLAGTSYVAPNAGGPGTPFQQFLSGGTFTITDNNTSNLLLSGSFTGADLSGAQDSGSGTVQFSGLVYSGLGSQFPAGYQTTGGSLSFNFDLLPAGPTNTFANYATDFGLAPFTGNDGSTFSALAGNGVPEPASFATFGVGAMALLGLAFAAKRRSLRSSL